MEPLESLFEFLFKYRPLLYERGQIDLGVPWPVLARGCGRGRNRGSDSPPLPVDPGEGVDAGPTGPDRVARWHPSRGALLPLSARARALDGRPAAKLRRHSPRRLAKHADRGRGGEASRGVHPGDLRAGRKRPRVGPFRKIHAAVLPLLGFGGTALRSRRASASPAPARTSARALERSLGELSNVPLAGMVLVTDGADNSTDAISDTLLDLQVAEGPGPYRWPRQGTLHQGHRGLSRRSAARRCSRGPPSSWT